MRRMLSLCARLDWHDASRDSVDCARAVVARFGPRHPASITTATIDEWVAEMRARGLSSARIRCLLSALRVMLRRAERMQWIDRMPLFPESRTLPRAEPRALVLEHEWVLALLLQLERMEQREASRMVRVLAETGLRLRECSDLTWDRVTLEGGRAMLLITQTKAHQPRRVPLSRAACAALVEQAQQGDRQGKVWSVSSRSLQRHHQVARDAVCQRLGLGEDVRRQWCIHTLRHTCLTRLASAGWTGPQLQAFAGHASLAVTQRYIHSSAVALPDMPAVLL
jgi:integrase